MRRRRTALIAINWARVTQSWLWVASRELREMGLPYAVKVVDITKDPEDRYAEHCKQADIMTAPLRDCLSYYNGHGDAEPGSLAYYGGGRWHKFRLDAQESLEPYVFEKR